MVQFNADVADGMPWRFIPTQREVHPISNYVFVSLFTKLLSQMSGTLAIFMLYANVLA